jgi:hypothetical protein
VVTHYKNFSASISRRAFVKLERFFVKPTRARLLVIFERKPKPLELSDLLGVFVSHEVDDVGNAQALKLFDVGPCSYHAAKG